MNNEKLSPQLASPALDLSLIEFNLSLTPEERLLNHQRALETINELIKAREQIYGKSQFTFETPS
ncbi:MAG: hypothetical protein B7Y39_09200 [Bdellovibrio sp. 28-41-41]|nr:MAG: hypothetical protein B7Y39_09200 [Bdellovibrio sp. 28-41-41]